MRKGILVKYLIYGVLLASSAGFTVWLQSAPPDQPLFLLRPVCWLTGLLSGASFTFETGLGYQGISAGGAFVVEKSCSGGNYLVICFVLLLLTQTGTKTNRGRIAAAGGALAIAYLFTLIATTMRLSSTVLLMGAGFGIDPVVIHNVTGIITYLVFICLCYVFACKLFEAIRKERMV